MRLGGPSRRPRTSRVGGGNDVIICCGVLGVCARLRVAGPGTRGIDPAPDAGRSLMWMADLETHVSVGWGLPQFVFDELEIHSDGRAERFSRRFEFQRLDPDPAF